MSTFQTLTGKEYLMADIACKHDKACEKFQWDERIAHFHTLNLDDSRIYKQASNPIGLRAAILAYQKTLRNEATGYMISLDAASSGMQLLSILIGCPVSFKLCGGDDSILDSYARIYESMDVGSTLTRKSVKSAIMTALYGSTATPEAVFGSNIDLFYETMETMAPGAWQLNMALQDLWTHVKGNTYDWVLPDNFYACIETKDKEVETVELLGQKHDIVMTVDARPMFHKGLGPNLIHSVDGMIVREMYRRCMFDKNRINEILNIINGTEAFRFGKKRAEEAKEAVTILWNHYKETGFLSVRILDYIDSDTITMVDELVIAKMVNSLPAKAFDVVAVHDCFRCHPNYGNDLRIQYNTIIADLNDSNLLKFLASQVVGRNVNGRKIGKIDREHIMQANYLIG
jgi:hypothetical protein